jgi:hypothetical protein
MTKKYQIVRFANGKYGVRSKRFFRGYFYYSASGFDYSSAMHVNQFCMFDTLDQAKECYGRLTITVQDIIFYG